MAAQACSCQPHYCDQYSSTLGSKAEPTASQTTVDYRLGCGSVAPVEYRTLPAHRRLWSWGWSSAAASTANSTRPPASSASSAEEVAAMTAWAGQFPTSGGGIVKFTLSATASFSIAVRCQAESEGSARLDREWTGVRVGCQSAELVYSRGHKSALKVLASAHFPGAGFGMGERNTFWLSFDPSNRTIKYGKGSCACDRTILSFRFAQSGEPNAANLDQQNISSIFSHYPKAIELQDYSGPQIIEHSAYEMPLMEQHCSQAASVVLEANPLVSNPSPRLLESQQMLLSDFDQRDFTFPSQLSGTGQKLSQQVLQPWLSLEAVAEEGHPKFTDAIDYSLKTPGAFLNSMLKEKMANLPSGTPPEQCQLTIALAPPAGSSPGPPVTLEILPPGHFSAPHDNANAHGILRVLHGFLDVSLFDSCLREADDAAPLDEVELDVGDAMWFSPTWYQTHAMRNEAPQYCCYMLARKYAEDDCVHWPYIQRKDADGQLQSSRVIADCDFRTLKSRLNSELQSALERNPDLLKTPTLSGLDEGCSARTQAWVDRTDSALDYTAYKELDEDFDNEDSKAHRFSCGPFTYRRQRKALPEPEFLFSTPLAVSEEPNDNFKMMWP